MGVFSLNSMQKSMNPSLSHYDHLFLKTSDKQSQNFGQLQKKYNKINKILNKLKNAGMK